MYTSVCFKRNLKVRLRGLRKISVGIGDAAPDLNINRDVFPHTSAGPARPSHRQELRVRQGQMTINIAWCMYLFADKTSKI